MEQRKSIAKSTNTYLQAFMTPKEAHTFSETKTFSSSGMRPSVQVTYREFMQNKIKAFAANNIKEQMEETEQINNMRTQEKDIDKLAKHFYKEIQKRIYKTQKDKKQTNSNFDNVYNDDIELEVENQQQVNQQQQQQNVKNQSQQKLKQQLQKMIKKISKNQQQLQDIQSKSIAKNNKTELTEIEQQTEINQFKIQRIQSNTTIRQRQATSNSILKYSNNNYTSDWRLATSASEDKLTFNKTFDTIVSDAQHLCKEMIENANLLAEYQESSKKYQKMQKETSWYHNSEFKRQKEEMRQKVLAHSKDSQRYLKIHPFFEFLGYKYTSQVPNNNKSITEQKETRYLYYLHLLNETKRDQLEKQYKFYLEQQNQPQNLKRRLTNRTGDEFLDIMKAKEKTRKQKQFLNNQKELDQCESQIQNHVKEVMTRYCRTTKGDPMQIIKKLRKERKNRELACKLGIQQKFHDVETQYSSYQDRLNQDQLLNKRESILKQESQKIFSKKRFDANNIYDTKIKWDNQFVIANETADQQQTNINLAKKQINELYNPKKKHFALQKYFIKCNKLLGIKV